MMLLSEFYVHVALIQLHELLRQPDNSITEPSTTSVGVSFSEQFNQLTEIELSRIS